jgi:hypothetical protein
MSTINPGRFAADPDTDVAVFLIGMRINQPLRVDKWGPVVTAMPPMLAHLGRHPETGYLGHHAWFGRTTILLSYWRSPEDIFRFASDRTAPHLEPWRTFQRRVGSDGSVGIWHETYSLQPGSREAVYVNMPDFGLAKAIGKVPVGAGLATARARMATGAAYRSEGTPTSPGDAG